MAEKTSTSMTPADFPQDRPLILITNDDGIAAPGLHALVDRVASLATVVVVAPSRQHSGQSSALTVGAPLHITRHPDYNGASMFDVTGTPVDCVKLGIHAVLGGRKPDLVLAGINHGSNSGVNVIYSGTMGAVMEGCLVGIPSVGFSYHSHDEGASMDACVPVVDTVVRKVLEKGLPEGICLNVNIPKCEAVKGIKVCRDARGYWTEEYAEYIDPTGRPFFWLTGRFHNVEPENPATDLYWTDRGYASVVPTRPDQTALDQIAPISDLFE